MARGHTLGMNRLEATSRIVRVVAAVLLVSLAVVSLHHLKDWRLHRVEASAERKLCVHSCRRNTPKYKCLRVIGEALCTRRYTAQSVANLPVLHITRCRRDFSAMP